VLTHKKPLIVVLFFVFIVVLGMIGAYRHPYTPPQTAPAVTNTVPTPSVPAPTPAPVAPTPSVPDTSVLDFSVMKHDAPIGIAGALGIPYNSDDWDTSTNIFEHEADEYVFEVTYTATDAPTKPVWTVTYKKTGEVVSVVAKNWVARSWQ
jgi:hypothetical protein